MKHLLFAAAGIGLAALLAPAPAGAQYRATDYGSGYEYGGRYGGQVRRERVCQPWCPYDYSPCDPPSFKIADRRCRLSDTSR